MNEDTTQTRGNLPRPLTDLVGRRHELEALERLLRSGRLLTLTGPGGSGKTRLALALADRVADAGVVADRAWWADLSSVEDDELVAEQVAAQLRTDHAPPEPALDALVARLRGEPSLLVLDNCEQVAAGCAQLTIALLSACPELTVIATSRRPLGGPDEQLFRVPGLALDGDQEGAVDLFLARARRHLPTLADDVETTAAIAQLSAQLDGMPLAIELAAARTPLLSVSEIASRLAEDSRLLKRRIGPLPERQRSLEAALSWSHRLLTDAEQAVFRRLAVFRGTFDLAAAEAVAEGGEVTGADVLELLASLVDHSLVETLQNASGTRYRLLLTVRQYGQELLERSGETTASQERHLRHYAAVAARSAAEIRSAAQARWLARLDAEQDNLRAALTFALSDDHEAAAELACDVRPYWVRRGLYEEGQRWLEDVIANCPDTSPAASARVAAAAASFAMLQCDYRLATERFEQSLALHRELGDPRGIAVALQGLAATGREQGRYPQAVELLQQSLAIWRRLSDDAEIADSLLRLGFVLWVAGEFERAQAPAERALDLFTARGQVQEVADAKLDLGAIRYYRGDIPGAVSLLDEAIELSSHMGYREGMAWALHERALAAAASHELGRAAELLVESLRLHWSLGDRWRTTRVLEDIAGLLLARTEPALAARLTASAASTRELLEMPVPAAERPAQDRYTETLRRTLPAAELESSLREGRAITLADAVAEADRAVRNLYFSGDAPRVHAEQLLTPRESQVLRLLAQGHTNREIGAALFISHGTAGVHVSSILRKLGVRTRAEAVDHAHELGLLGTD